MYNICMYEIYNFNLFKILYNYNKFIYTQILYNKIYVQSILERDDVIGAYARKWRHYKLASQFTSMICDYLNKRVLDDSKNRGTSTATAAADKHQTVGDGKYKRQTIHAVG